MSREFFWDEDVLRIQNEVRRYNDEQKGVRGSERDDDKLQGSGGAGADTAALPVESRGDFVQNTHATDERE